MDELRTTQERIDFVSRKKPEETKEEDKEKPKYADLCVDFPRDPPREDVQ